MVLCIMSGTWRLCNSGASDIFLVGVAMCPRAVDEDTFPDLSFVVPRQERLVL